MDNNFFKKKLKITHVILKISEKSYRNGKKKGVWSSNKSNAEKKIRAKKRK
jgi:hypothetical protein